MSSRKATRSRKSKANATTPADVTEVEDDESPDPVRSTGLAAIMRAVAAGCEDDVETVYKQYGDRILDMADKDGFTPLYVAAQNGHASVVIQLVDFGATIDLPNPIGYSALFVASQMGHVNVVMTLLDLKANVNMSDINIGGTALYIAVQSGQSKNVHMLLEGQANPNMVNSQGGTALMSACHGGKLKIIRSLVEHKAAVNMQDAGGCNALIIAVQQGYVEVTNVLIDSKADVNLHTRNGVTALIWAAHNRKPSVVKRLIECEADLDMADADDLTAFYIAAQKGYPEIASLLIRAGSDMNLPNNKGILAIDMARQQGHEKVVDLIEEAQKEQHLELLMKSVADGDVSGMMSLLQNVGGDVNMQDMMHRTPLLQAIEHGNLEMVTKLLSIGASVNQVVEPDHELKSTAISRAIHFEDMPIIEAVTKVSSVNLNLQLAPENLTYLHLAIKAGVKSGNDQVVEFLASRGCSVNLKNAHEQTAFMEAVATGRDRMISCMMAKAKLNMQNSAGDTSLMIAIQKGQTAIAKKLANKTELSCVNKKGYNALHLAVVNSEWMVLDPHLDKDLAMSQLLEAGKPLLQHLLDAGAHVNQPDPIGNTPGHQAANSGDVGTLNLLLRSRADLTITNQKGHTIMDIINSKADGEKTQMLNLIEDMRKKAEQDLLAMYESEEPSKTSKKSKKRGKKNKNNKNQNNPAPAEENKPDAGAAAEAEALQVLRQMEKELQLGKEAAAAEEAAAEKKQRQRALAHEKERLKEQAVREKKSREKAEAENARQRAAKEEKARLKLAAEEKKKQDESKQQAQQEITRQRAAKEEITRQRAAKEEITRQRAAKEDKVRLKLAADEKKKLEAVKAAAEAEARAHAARADSQQQQLKHQQQQQLKHQQQQQQEQERAAKIESSRKKGRWPPEEVQLPVCSPQPVHRPPAITQRMQRPKSPLSKPVEVWSLQEVQELLGALGLEDHCSTFEAEDIDGSCLVDLETEDFVEIGMECFGEQRRLKNALERLKEGQSAVLRHSGIRSWTVEAVKQHLEQHNLPQSAQLCAQHRVNGDTLLTITKEEIRVQLEVPTMKEKKGLEKAIEKLRLQANDEQRDTTPSPNLISPFESGAGNSSICEKEPQMVPQRHKMQAGSGYKMQQLEPEAIEGAPLSDAEMEGLCCPLSLEPMTDPVIAADGHTYERIHIQQWLSKHDTSPMTNEVLSNKTLIPNHVLRALVAKHADL